MGSKLRNKAILFENPLYWCIVKSLTRNIEPSDNRVNEGSPISDDYSCLQDGGVQEAALLRAWAVHDAEQEKRDSA